MATTHPPTHPPNSRAPNRPPDLTAFTVAHRALRTDGARLAAATAGLGAGDTARAQALRRWYRGFEAELTGHHTMEDRLWFPLLAERVPTFAQHTDRIDREHHQVYVLESNLPLREYRPDPAEVSGLAVWQVNELIAVGLRGVLS